MNEIKSPNCVFCSHPQSYIKPFAQRNTEALSLYGCPDCGSQSLFPQPSDEWLKEVYKNYYTRRKIDSGEGAKTKHFEVLFKNLNRFLSSLPPNPKILEIGPGEGESLKVMRALWPKASLTALEANLEAKPFFEKINCTLISESAEEWLQKNKEQNYDLVVFFDVLEHFRDPSKVVELLIQNVLKPQGYLIATFPNVKALSQKLMQGVWFQYKVEHLHYPSPKGIQRLAQRTHLKSQVLKPLKKTLPIDYLISVGMGFGNSSLQQLSKLTQHLLPQKLKSLRVPLGFGESLWVAQKN